MRYCTISDLLLKIPPTSLAQLSNDDPTATTYDAAVVEEFVREAEELIDGYLRGRYDLPLVVVPSIIKDLTVTLARYGLYARRPEGIDVPDAVKSTHRGALDTLRAIRAGTITIGASTGGGEQAAEPGEIKISTRPKRFDDNAWGAYDFPRVRP